MKNHGISRRRFLGLVAAGAAAAAGAPLLKGVLATAAGERPKARHQMHRLRRLHRGLSPAQPPP